MIATGRKDLQFIYKVHWSPHMCNRYKQTVTTVTITVWHKLGAQLGYGHKKNRITVGYGSIWLLLSWTRSDLDRKCICLFIVTEPPLSFFLKYGGGLFKDGIHLINAVDLGNIPPGVSGRHITAEILVQSSLYWKVSSPACETR